MLTSRLHGRRGDGSAAVRGWVAFTRSGCPPAMRARRRDEVAGDLRGRDPRRRPPRRSRGLFRQRLVRLALGIPADLSWRLIDAPAMARELYGPTPWVPLTRWTLALTRDRGDRSRRVASPSSRSRSLTGQAGRTLWPGWGPVGFAIGSAVVLRRRHRRPCPGRDAAAAIVILPGVAPRPARRAVAVGRLDAGGHRRRARGPTRPTLTPSGRGHPERAMSFLERVDLPSAEAPCGDRCSASPTRATSARARTRS